MQKNPWGQNNFGRLEAAGCVAGADDSENLKAKTETRVAELNTLTAKVKKLEAHLIVLPTLEKPRQLKRLAAASVALKELLATKLPTGAKKHIEACLNEVTSLREGVYVSNSKLDKQTLALTASAKARQELQALVESAEHRLEKVMADSSDESSMDDFLKKAGDVIKKNDHESHKLTPVLDKPFVLVRVPVVPVDGSISAEKLPRLGFKSESIGGYPVIHNQLVLGINPKYLAEHDPETTNHIRALVTKMKTAGHDIDEIKKVQNSLKMGKLKVEQLAIDDKARGTNKNAHEIERINGLIAKAQVKIDKFTQDVGDPDIVRDQIDSLRHSQSKVPVAVKEESKRIIKALEKKLKVKLQLVSDKPTPQIGAVWFWLMPDKELNQLARASLSNRVSIKNWGFAFN